MSDQIDPTTLRFCRDCKHLLGNRSYPDNTDNWRCHAEGNLNASSYDLVSGKKLLSFVEKDCYAARDNPNSCGQTGRWYEEYIKPDYYAVGSKVENIPPKPKSLKTIGLDDL